MISLTIITICIAVFCWSWRMDTRTNRARIKHFVPTPKLTPSSITVGSLEPGAFVQLGPNIQGYISDIEMNMDMCGRNIYPTVKLEVRPVSVSCDKPTEPTLVTMHKEPTDEPSRK